MDTLLELEAGTESVSRPAPAPGERPEARWVKGECPHCGEPLISCCYYVGGRGYLITLECWGYVADPKTCDYRRVL